MERKLTKKPHSHVEVMVTVDENSWKEAQKKAFEKIASTVQIDGFRKGKAPLNMVKSKIDQVKVMDEAINSLLPSIYRDIIEKDGVKPYAQPKVDVTKLSDTELEVKFEIVTAPEITLGKYKGLKLGKPEAKVTKKEVDDAVNATVAQNATLVIKEGAAALGDTVVMDFVGKVDDKEFEGGSAKNHELELGSGQFIPGFEDQLVGKKAGEHVDVKVTFPKQYTPELAGKDAVFACDIHEVKSKKMPELNDEFVKDLGIAGVETVDALRKNKESELTANKEREARREFLNKLYDMVAKDSKIDMPEEIVDAQVESMKEDMENRMKQSGLTLEQYLTFVGQKEEEFMKKLREDATRDVINYMLIEKIGQTENMEISDADVEFEMAKIADQYKMKIEDVKKALEPQKAEFRNNLKMQRIEEFLLKENE
ncbi:MAG: trigger factor [Bacilli bacterium]|nr:trigger factor [Bacilli bacterium]